MANLSISQLTPGNPAQSGDVIPIDRSDVNFSITAGSIAALAPAGVTSVGFEGDGTVLSSTESGPVTGSGILSATLNHTECESSSRRTGNRFSSNTDFSFASSCRLAVHSVVVPCQPRW